MKHLKYILPAALIIVLAGLFIARSTHVEKSPYREAKELYEKIVKESPAGYDGTLEYKQVIEKLSSISKDDPEYAQSQQFLAEITDKRREKRKERVKMMLESIQNDPRTQGKGGLQQPFTEMPSQVTPEAPKK